MHNWDTTLLWIKYILFSLRVWKTCWLMYHILKSNSVHWLRNPADPQDKTYTEINRKPCKTYWRCITPSPRMQKRVSTQLIIIIIISDLLRKTQDSKSYHKGVKPRVLSQGADECCDPHPRDRILAPFYFGQSWVTLPAPRNGFLYKASAGHFVDHVK